MALLLSPQTETIAMVVAFKAIKIVVTISKNKSVRDLTKLCCEQLELRATDYHLISGENDEVIEQTTRIQELQSLSESHGVRLRKISTQIHPDNPELRRADTHHTKPNLDINKPTLFFNPAPNAEPTKPREDDSARDYAQPAC